MSTIQSVRTVLITCLIIVVPFLTCARAEYRKPDDSDAAQAFDKGAEPKVKPGSHKQQDSPAGNGVIPRFCQYPATVKFTGKPAPLNFDSNPGARRFQTRLEKEARRGPNFAGSFTIVDWGCGTACQSWVIINAKNGRIFSPGFALSDGVWYRLDSALVVVDPIDADTRGDVGMIDTTFMVWDGMKLKEIGKIRSTLRRSDLEQCP